MSKKLKNNPKSGHIPLQIQDMGPEFAGFQYMLPEGKNTTRMYKPRRDLFKESLLRLLYSNFKWTGITVEQEKAIEHMLITQGRVCAVKTYFDLNEETPDNGLFFGRFSNDNGLVNFYGNPINAEVTGYNNKKVKARTENDFAIGFDTCAVDRNQFLIRPLMFYVDMLATELNDAYEAWKVAAATRKVGMVFQCKDKNTANVLKKVLKDISENDPYIVIESNALEGVEVLFTPKNDDAITTHHNAFMQVIGFVLDMFGMEHSVENERERMLVSEVQMNRTLARYIGADRERARNRFCDEMNEKHMSNTPISVENYLASMVTESIDGKDLEGGGDNNGESNDV